MADHRDVTEHLRKLWNSEIEIDVAPWHRPKAKVVGPGVTMTTTYGSHVIAALLYAAWKKVRRAR